MAPADRDHGIGRRDDDEVADDAQARGDRRLARTRSPRTDRSREGRRSSPRRRRGASRGRPHDAAKAAGDDRRSAPREHLPDLLGPLEQAMCIRPARVAIADHRDDAGSSDRRLDQSWAGPPSGNDASVSYRADPPPRWLRMRLQLADGRAVPSGAAADAASIQPRRSTGRCRARASVTWARYGSVGSSPEPRGGPCEGCERAVGSSTAVPRTRALARPRERRRADAGGAGHRGMPGGHSLDGVRDARDGRRLDGAEERQRQVEGLVRDPAQPSGPRVVRARPRRRARAERRRSSPIGTATKQRQRRSRHRPSRRASTIGSSSSSAVMTGTSSGSSGTIVAAESVDQHAVDARRPGRPRRRRRGGRRRG